MVSSACFHLFPICHESPNMKLFPNFLVFTTTIEPSWLLVLAGRSCPMQHQRAMPRSLVCASTNPPSGIVVTLCLLLTANNATTHLPGSNPFRSPQLFLIIRESLSRAFARLHPVINFHSIFCPVQVNFLPSVSCQPPVSKSLSL